jgi:hypothetical protein
VVAALAGASAGRRLADALQPPRTAPAAAPLPHPAA